MKKTLLDLVQRILSSMDSEEVNSISDTTESMQVAYLVQEAYENIITRANLPELYTIYQLEASGSIAKPIVMTIPTGIDNVLWIKYNKVRAGDTDPVWEAVYWMEPADFLEMVQGYAPSDPIVDTATITYRGNNMPIYYTNNAAPQYYTSIDDRTLVFDSYDAAVDTTLQKSKTEAYGMALPTFTLDDDFVPDLDARQFPLLYQEAKALAFAELKQTTNAKAEKEARRQWISSQHNKNGGRANVPYRDTLSNYGRK